MNNCGLSGGEASLAAGDGDLNKLRSEYLTVFTPAELVSKRARNEKEKVLVFGVGLWIMALPMLPGISQTAKNIPTPEKEIQTAREISQQLIAKLRSMLTHELKVGGLEGAVEACSQQAQEVQGQLSRETGHSVRRISLGYRNPSSKPDRLEIEVLKQFDRLNHEGNMPPELHRITTEKKGRYLRYFKPIVANSFCLTCHGSSQTIPESVQTILKKSYRFDRATGYREGDVRGAVSIKIALP